MPRLARIVIPGVPHHIVQRGNNRQDVFFVEDDRRVYLAYLQEAGFFVPLATDRTVAKFKKLLGRRLRPLGVGRPKGAKDKRKRRRRRTEHPQ